MSDVQTRVGIVPEVVGAESAAGEIAKVYRALRDGSMDAKTANAALREYSGEVLSTRRSIMYLRTEFRNTHATMLEGMRALTSVAAIGRTLTNVFQTYTLMQMRVADKTQDVRDTEEELAKVQESRQQIVRDLGVDSIYALTLMDEEDRLTKRLSEEKRDLSKAQQDNILGYAGIAFSLVDVVAKTYDVYYHYKILSELMGAGLSTAGLSSVATSALAAKVAVAGLQTSYMGLIVTLAPPLIAMIAWKVTLDWAEGQPEEMQQKIRDAMALLGPGSPVEPGFGGGGGVGGGGGGAREGGGTNVNVEGQDVDVDVDIVVTPKPPKGGSGGKYR